eukprot:TRINITY_DN4036_c0_g1_i1.p3 TRINITY_DN4036_c0_g1~~TRINITY_DN4036_c0_g1_i1.p3  ORF type:complete len:146 (-),score=45.26 TRINITY_DN4036_c0_g1_i1:542-979(-)
MNIIRCYEVVETKNYVYIVMERVSGGELFDLIGRKKYFSEFESCYITYHLLKALHYLHSFGIMHRDLKPENILVELNQTRDHVITLKLIDFGIACMIKEDGVVNDSCGTLSYVAPEVLLKQWYNTKVDMWSVGIIVFTMYSQSNP